MKLAILCGLLALVLPPWLSARGRRSAEPLVIVENGRYGFIDHNGKVIIPPRFLWAFNFEDELGTVYVCGREVAIDSAGNLLPLASKQKLPDLRPTSIGGKFVFIDAAGRRLGEFVEALPFSEGLAAVSAGSKWGFIDAAGKVVIPFRFDSAFYFVEGVADATIGDDWVLIDKSGRVLTSGYEHFEGTIAEGLIPVSKDGKHGYLDLQAAIAIPLEYDSADTFSEGLAPVEKNGKWGYIDKSGATVIPFKFDSAGVFGSGLAPVRRGEESGFIDTSGKFAFWLAFQQASGFWNLEYDTDVSAFWTKDNSFGYVNSSGRVIWGPSREAPDHAPIVGWSEEDKARSCVGVPEDVRKKVASFPTVE